MLRQSSMKSFTTDDRDIFTSNSRVSCDWRVSEITRNNHSPSPLSQRRSNSIGDLISKWQTLDSLNNDIEHNIQPLKSEEGSTGEHFVPTKLSLKGKFSSSFDVIEENHERMSKSEVRFEMDWEEDDSDNENNYNKNDLNNNNISTKKDKNNNNFNNKDLNSIKDLNNNKDLNSIKDLNNNKNLNNNKGCNIKDSKRHTQLDNEIACLSIKRIKPGIDKDELLRYANLNSMNSLYPPCIEALKGAGLTRKDSYKVSRNLSRRMTKRQKQKLIMDSEFDEFEDFNEDEKMANKNINNKKNDVVDNEYSGKVKGDGGNIGVDIGYSNNSKVGNSDVDEKVSRDNNAGKTETKKNTKEDRKASEDNDEDLILKINMKNIQETMAFSAQDSSDLDTYEEDDEDEEDDEVDGKVVLTKVQKIAEELLMTEKNYIDRLKLLDQLFQLNVTLANRQQNFFPANTIPDIFSNIKSIYQFHTFLYPQLEKAVVGLQQPTVGEVLSRFGPFLKLYIEYVRNFSQGINLLNYWMDKSAPFNKLIFDLQKRPECGHLTLQHHMLEPVQRVPRYELLLRDYLKNLPDSSSDKPFALKSLQIVKDAAQHSNDAMRKIEKFKRLLDVNEKLGDAIDLVSPTRELVKEGRITRVARDGSFIERYIFLFNDLLLVCQAFSLTQQYRIKSKMNLDDMEITESHNLEIPNTFYVRCQQKSIELHCSTQEEKIDWQMVFWKVINEFQDKLKTRKKRMTVIYPVKTDVLGKRAPLWVKDNETSMCMRCSVAFNPFKRRHHCRACGLVVCRVCSAFKTHLDFTGNHEDRVCTFCHQVLAGNQAGYLADLGEVSVTHATTKVMEGVKAGKMRLQIQASAPSVMSGYMNLSRDRHNWTKRYFTAHPTFILYSFKAHQDVVAMASLPLPGYHVKMAEPNELLAKENMFKIYHDGEKKIYYFHVENIDIFFKWIEILQMLSRLETPPTEPATDSSFSPPTTPKSP